jgi:hypothetical protein
VSAVISLLLFLPVPAKAEILQFNLRDLSPESNRLCPANSQLGKQSLEVLRSTRPPLADPGHRGLSGIRAVSCDGGDYPWSGQTGALKVLNDFRGSFEPISMRHLTDPLTGLHSMG